MSANEMNEDEAPTPEQVAQMRAQAVAMLARKPAFARPVSHDETPSGMVWGNRVEFHQDQQGLTFRQYAATKLAAAMVVAFESGESVRHFGGGMGAKEVAKLAVEYADALIERLAE